MEEMSESFYFWNPTLLNHIDTWSPFIIIVISSMHKHYAKLLLVCSTKERKFWINLRVDNLNELLFLDKQCLHTSKLAYRYQNIQ